jgi:hypothetical protein
LIHLFRNTSNELQLGDLSFIYTSVPSRYRTKLEAAIGFGIVTVILTPLDKNGHILFPSTAPADLSYNQNVILKENCYKVKSTQDELEIKNWDGFKIAVSLWSKGSVELEALKHRIDSAFQHTLVDYTIESYYRSSKWYALPSRKKLPDLPSSSHPFEMGEHQPAYTIVLNTLPAILETGSSRKNPVIQSIRIDNRLPLDSILTGVRAIFTDEEVQAYFFSRLFDKLFLMDAIPEPSQGYSRDYIVIGASDIYSAPKHIDRRPSVLSDTSSTASSSPRLGTVRLTKSSSLESLSEDIDNMSASRVGLNFDIEEIFIFPDVFYPSFPVYGKRSSFFLICLFEDHVSVSTYKYFVLM